MIGPGTGVRVYLACGVSYAKVIAEMDRGCLPEDPIRHVDRKHLNNRMRVITAR